MLGVEERRGISKNCNAAASIDRHRQTQSQDLSKHLVDW